MKKLLPILLLFFLLANSVSAATFSRSLKLGMKGADVLLLQQLLNKNPSTQVSLKGDGSPTHETTYFGLATYKAVIKFQELYKSEILTPAHLTKGTGFVGPTTIKKLN